MKIIFSKHAEDEMKKRKIERRDALKVIKNPQQKSVVGNLHVYQSIYSDKLLGKEMLLRVFIKESLKSLEIITMYKTSKIKKYWKV